MARLAEVHALQPVPWFPILRPATGANSNTYDRDLCIDRRRMFYLPGALKRLDAGWLCRSILPVLRQWHNEAGLDLIDAHFGYPEGVGSVLAAGRLGIPAFVTLRGNEQVYLKDSAIRSQLVEALHASRGIIAVSRALRDAAVSAGIDARKIRVIPNAVDRTEFSPGDKQAARTQLGLPIHSPVIVSVGQLVSGKGHHLLVQAVHELRICHPDIVLAIVGGTAYERDYPRQLQATIDSLEMNTSVRLAGSQTPAQVANWLRAADVFALCTEREGCCNAILEALACGVPVVTTDVGDNAVYVDPPTNGYVVSPESATEVSAALERSLGRGWDAREISARLPQADWATVARAVIDFFESQLNAGTRDTATAEQ
jgi:glycosyltransferase involved in cell wall biosynthesis